MEILQYNITFWDIHSQDIPDVDCLILCNNDKYYSTEPDYVLYKYDSKQISFEPIAYFREFNIAVEMSNLYLDKLNNIQ